MIIYDVLCYSVLKQYENRQKIDRRLFESSAYFMLMHY